MTEKLHNNPFAALFSSVKEAEQYVQKQLPDPVDSQLPPASPDKSVGNGDDYTSTLLEDLLLLTTRAGPHTSPRVQLPDTTSQLTVETLPHMLFERLLLESPGVHAVGTSIDEEKIAEATREEVVVYLSEVYRRCWAARDKPHSIVAKQVQEAVITNLATALEQPELYMGQHPDRQLLKLLQQELGREAAIEELTCRLTKYLVDQGATSPPPLFTQLVSEVTKQLGECTLMTVDYHLVDILDFFAASPFLATLITITPEKVRQGQTGRGYQSTPLGSLLTISCLPKHFRQPYEFFEKPSAQPAQAHKNTENSIWLAQNNINSRLCKIFYSLLKVSPEAKAGLLTWVESCLETNRGREGLWHVQGAGGFQSNTYVSDGFMVNLGAVMLQLAQPFTQDLKTAKILKVDPTYCVAPRVGGENGVPGAYTGDLGKQTMLVPPAEDNSPLSHSKQYSFISTCFFLTHRALHLGVQVVQQKLHKLSQELGRIQQEFQELFTQGSPAMEMMRSLVESRTTNYLSMKAAIFEPHFAESLLQFLAASAEWLVQMALCPPDQLTPPTALQEVNSSLPDDTHTHTFLQCIPEFLVETLTETISTVRRYNAILLDSSGCSALHPHFMSFIVVFMGSPKRMNNPHLRAHLAECLETLLPGSGGASLGRGLLVGYREQLFTSHPLSSHLVPALIHVFVSIEMTGQSVSFEEKFNYRRPMYEVIKFLWESPKHRKKFKELANEALANMEAAQPPLFLRFVNLLINDSIFLLDEGLSYMSQLRESQKERENGEWTNLSASQRTEREQGLQHMTLLARFHNMLGAHTTQTLVKLTKEIPQMFTHGTLIDRMSAMLNYFLSTLVGPKQRNLKVRDMEKYEFHPGETVSDICTIYTHLYSNKAFCLAVSADGRSYTPQLFSQAYNVLCRIGRGTLAEQMQEVAEKVVEASQALEEDENIVADAPEEFIDPIMLHLMTDPVTLPSSKLTVDRQTIARHLLSDQTDPFTRQPLNMEEVESNTELKQRINNWLEEQRALRRKDSTTQGKASVQMENEGTPDTREEME